VGFPLFFSNIAPLLSPPSGCVSLPLVRFDLFSFYSENISDFLCVFCVTEKPRGVVLPTRLSLTLWPQYVPGTSNGIDFFFPFVDRSFIGRASLRRASFPKPFRLKAHFRPAPRVLIPNKSAILPFPLLLGHSYSV